MKVAVVGAGGHARSVLWALRSTGEHEVVALTDPDARLHGTEVDGVVVVGGDDCLAALRDDGVRGAVMGVGGVRDNAPRERLFGLARELGFELPWALHAAAAVSERSVLASGAVVLAGALVGPGARLGENVIVNSAAVLEHDVVVGDHAHIASGAVLGGGVRVGERAHVGAGAVILQEVAVGPGAVVGAGAVVTSDVAPGAVVVGVPARAVER